MAITAVLFDLDDTLFDHSACTRAALADLREQFGVLGRVPAALVEGEHRRLLEALHLRVLAGQLTVDDARIERFRHLLELAGGVADAGAAVDAASAYRAAYLSHWRPVEGSLELLAALHGRVSTGVVTNNVASEQRQKIAACGFGPLLDAVIISEEAGVAKPDPRIFSLALEALGCAAGETVMIGDAWETDIAGARAAGIRPIWFNRLGAASPDRRVTELRTLMPLSAVLSVLFPNPESRIPPVTPKPAGRPSGEGGSPESR
ncbi:MAG: HAD family hydrolase [Vicinamibacterales bacterium]